jgi:sarcosine oxidase
MTARKGMSGHDVIVIGLGGMGTAACLALARRGARVLGLEQFPLGHDRGSSHGGTRIIRTAYYEHPAYVPLVRRAFQGWYDLEQSAGQHLLRECPCLNLGSPDSGVVAGVLRAADEHALPVERLSSAEVRKRYPVFRIEEDTIGVLERSAGILAVDACVRAQAEAAVQAGAELRQGERVLSHQKEGKGVVVRTDQGVYHADRLVICAGPWAGSLLSGCGVPLTVMRQVVFWLEVRHLAHFRRDVVPVFIAETAEGAFYGLPAVDTAGVKVARHYGAPELPGPEQVVRTVTEEDEVEVRRFVRAYLPEADGATRRSSVCLYTLTPDRHFVIDTLPEGPVVAAGFSGHGFKFAPVVGEILADLALDGKTNWSIELFRIGRFGH